MFCMHVLDLYADWVIDSGVPLNTSDNEKFKKLFAYMDPDITIPGRHGTQRS